MAQSEIADSQTDIEDFDSMYVSVAEGTLTDPFPRIWVTPGETYQVSVHVKGGYVEAMARQVGGDIHACSCKQM